MAHSSLRARSTKTLQMAQVISFAVVVSLLILPAATAAADTIEKMVQNTGAMESPFWRQMYESGFGYLDAKRVSNDSKIACANREAGVPPNQAAQLLQSRGYTSDEAWSIVTAELAASHSAHSVC